MGGSIGCHPCIGKVRFESSHGVFLYVVMLNEIYVLLVKLIKKVDLYI